MNEDPTEKLIADLRAENDRLKKMLQSASLSSSLTDSKSLLDEGAVSKQDEEALRKQLEENEKSMKQMQQSYEEKLAAAKAKVREKIGRMARLFGEIERI